MSKAEETPAGLNKSAFHGAFAKLSPAILEEWGAKLEATELAATEGDYDKVVALIVERTAHTKALVRRQLEEIYRVVTAPPRAADARRMARAAGEGVQAAISEAMESVDDVLHEIEKRTAKLMRDLRGNVIDQARGKLRDHLVLSLFVTLGLGFIVGVIFNGLSSHGANKDK